MVVVVQEGRLFVGVDDLDFKVKDVTFEVKVLTSMTPLIKFQIGQKI
jgi:hypothetical protein